MPEGHTIHRLAREHAAVLQGQPVALASPQGRFASGAALLTGRVLERVEPYGKHLFYVFEGDALLHVHLGLYGKFTTGTGQPPEPQGALRLRMTGGGHWFDLRGPIACEVHAPPDRDRLLTRLGPDPLRKDADPDRAWDRLSRSRAPVGQLLMDQTVLAGVGNVYRAEVLFRAGLSPFTPGTQVRRPAWEALWQDTRTLMRAGVRAGRIVTTVPADRDRRSGPVAREDAHYVYRRAGLACRRCGTEVRTQPMAARNLFWCPQDQA
ncbi:MAG: Formamidopyrimidine-DNA glycosylase [Frankiales bacterium]|nr:Formamidopyrimidine-DNA glycosylase [Frankiales bacterium]